MAWTPDKLTEAKSKVDANEKITLSVRELLGWFSSHRRSYWNVRIVRDALKEAGLETLPNFEYVSLDSTVELVKVKEVQPTSEPQPSQALTGPENETTSSPTESTETQIDPETSPPLTARAFDDVDPTYRIGRLASAGRTPLYVAPDAKLAEIVTQMMMNDYSQLPVMTSIREVKGIVSWKSIGAKLALGQSIGFARECMEPAHEVKYDEPLFKAINLITEHEYVLVRNEKKEIGGIVTTSDLSVTYDQLGEQFFLLGEIENHIRSLADGKYSVVQLREAVDGNDPERQVSDISDLTFGEYIRLLENESRWDALAVKIDRVLFIKELDRVRLIRNDVMHFDPDGISPDEVITLRKFVRFLQRINEISST